MIQQVIIAVLFVGALAYIGRVIYRNFQARSGCASGCGQCHAIDFNKIEKQIQQKGL